MKHITIGEINKFECIGSKCPSTCCAYWTIIVDKETDKYYQSVEGAFGEELREKIDRSKTPAIMKLQDGGRCPFLNEENLCRVYMELGPERMCKTCKTYPRRERDVGDIIFHYMTVSCPEVGRIFLSRKTPLEMRVIEDDAFRREYPVKSPDWTFFSLAEKAFHANMAILQCRSYSVAERERAFLLFNRSLQDALDADRLAEAETLIGYFSVPKNYASLVGSKLSGQLSSKVRLFRELCEFFLTREQGSVAFRMFVNAIRYIHSESADMDALSDALKALDGAEFQREQEHFLAYLLFSHYLSDSMLDASAKRNLFGNSIFILTLFQFYRIFAAIYSVMQKKTVDLNARTLIVSYLSRYFEHSPEKFRAKFHDTLEKRQFYDMGFLFQLIS